VTGGTGRINASRDAGAHDGTRIRTDSRLIAWPVLVFLAAASVSHHHAFATTSMRAFDTKKSVAHAAGQNPGQAGERVIANEPVCDRYLPKDPTIYLTDFRWGLATEQFKKFGRDLYFSDKRLAHRFYISENGLINAPVSSSVGNVDIVVPRAFISIVKRHFGTAFRLHIIDHLAMSDLGHAHIYIQTGNVADATEKRFYKTQSLRNLFKEQLYLLYHSAERLKMKNERGLSTDPYTQLRFLTRNFVGEPDGRIRIVYDINNHLISNSVAHLGELGATGQVLYINANHRGCFALDAGNTRIRFDLSFSAPSGEPGFNYEE
jgi:hypothetical protein